MKITKAIAWIQAGTDVRICKLGTMSRRNPDGTISYHRSGKLTLKVLGALVKRGHIKERYDQEGLFLGWGASRAMGWDRLCDEYQAATTDERRDEVNHAMILLENL